MATELATTSDSAAALAEQVVIKGDLSKLTEQQRMSYYSAVCQSLGLNPLTRPFEFITLNGKLTLYATRAAADQLRAIRGITITSLDPRQVGELLVVVATGRDRTGREDSATGAVSTKGLTGEALANAMMKAETKSKRRLTLSLAGLGWSDETEVESIGVRADVDPATGEIRRPATLADRVATRRAEIAVPAKPEAVESDAKWVEVEPAAAYDNGLTPQQFIAMAKAHGLGNGQLVKTAKAMFPDAAALSDLTDDQRGALLDALVEGPASVDQTAG